MRQFSLEFLTALEADAPTLVELAARHGYGHVGLLVQPMRPFPFYDLLRDTKMRRETRKRCLDLGIKVDSADGFILQPETDPEAFRGALESSAYLGTNWINVLALDREESRLMDSFGGLCNMAREYGMKVGTEVNRHFVHDTLDNTVAFLKKLGDPDARVTLDSMHFFRHVGTIESLKQHANWIGRVHLCDGPAEVPFELQRAEGRTRRLPPGDGALPLQEFLAVLPRDLVLGLEVPNPDMTMTERIARSLAQARALTERVDAAQRA